ncbi:MAG: non-hydrolyzing UDP-N-acetylglucosamine 2-epimerase [Allosphingosinicella sp.]
MAADGAAGGAARIVSIVGTRPEAIKLAPVVRAVSALPALRQGVVLTGQHGGLRSAFQGQFADLFELGCDPRDRSAPRLREALHRHLCGHFQRHRADLILVQGDTASAFAGAMAARDCGIPVGHVEAGLRSGDLNRPWPEEGNRIAIDALSDLLFAPTEHAAANLRADWRATGQIHVTGNTGIDALLAAKARIGEMPPGRTILATCHRRENQGPAFAGIAAALARIARELGVEIVFPLHLNRHLRAEAEALLGGVPGVRLVEPADHEGMVRLMLGAFLILTDSGGLQEEAPALGRPVLVLRDTTERPEAIASGNAELVGAQPEAIFAAVSRLLADPARLALMSRPAFPFGDGRAAPRIAAAVERWFRPRASTARAAAPAPRARPPAAR